MTFPVTTDADRYERGFLPAVIADKTAPQCVPQAHPGRECGISLPEKLSIVRFDIAAVIAPENITVQWLILTNKTAQAVINRLTTCAVAHVRKPLHSGDTLCNWLALQLSEITKCNTLE